MNGPALALAGMHKLTTLDYPGLLAAVLFTQGCNFNCPYCHNPQLIKSGAGGLEVSAVLAFLKKRRGLLDGLVISGGEPTLQPGLAHFCRAVKDLGYAVKLDSNGSRPGVLKALLRQNLVDYVAMDCKAPANRYYPALCNEKDAAQAVAESAALLRSAPVAHEFRSTCVSPFVQRGHVRSMAALIGAESPWFLQAARLDEGMRARGLRELDREEMEELARAARAARGTGGISLRP